MVTVNVGSDQLLAETHNPQIERLATAKQLKLEDK